MPVLPDTVKSCKLYLVKHLFLYPRRGCMLYSVIDLNTLDIEVKEKYMPIYDFQCEHCGHTEEILVNTKLQDFNKLLCSKCKQEGMKKLITGGGSFRLYGEGFYRRTHKDTGDWAS